MNREICPICRCVILTTNTPSVHEGNYINDQLINKLDKDSKHGSFDIYNWLKNNYAPACIQCPSCGKVSSIDEDEEAEHRETHKDIYGDKYREQLNNEEKGYLEGDDAEDFIIKLLNLKF